MSSNFYDATQDKLTRIAGGTLWADSPIGSIIPFGGATAPSGWFLCDGTAISRTTFSELFAVIGTAFGSGDGSTTFNLPDMREVVPVGAGTSNRSAITDHDAYSLGQFKDDQIQGHIHYAYTGRRNGWLQFAAATADGVQIRSQGDDYNNAYSVGEAAQARISTTTHGKQLGVNYIIKAKMVAVPADFLAKVDEAVVENNEYSTTETVIGKWIDDKPIYRKVVDLPSAVEIQNLGTSGTEICPWGDIDTLVRGICKGSTDSVTQLVLFFKNTTSNTVNVSKVNVGITLNVKTAILEYTKTTD